MSTQQSTRSDAQWQDDLNTAHLAILMGTKLKALGVMSEEQIQKCWEIQTAASVRGFVPENAPSARERQYKILLVRHGLLDFDGNYISRPEVDPTEGAARRKRVQSSLRESATEWCGRFIRKWRNP